jgi:hypothetical protein
MNIHKKYLKAVTIAALVAIISAVSPHRADSQLQTNVPNDISGEGLWAVVVEDFEKASAAKTFSENGWFVETTPKKLENTDNDEKRKLKNPVLNLEYKIMDGSPNDMQTENWSLTELGKEKQKCLGIRFRFRYPGFNSVHVLPPLEVDWKERNKPAMTYNTSTKKDEQERAIQLPGRARGVSMWVHSRGKPYTLEVWIKDYKGNSHILQMGSLKFVGWRPMKAYIPLFVPQSSDSYPQTRMTKITKFVIRANVMAPKETLLEDTFVFFDQLKVLTDTYEVNFDGNELHKKFEGEK